MGSDSSDNEKGVEINYSEVNSILQNQFNRTLTSSGEALLESRVKQFGQCGNDPKNLTSQDLANQIISDSQCLYPDVCSTYR